MRQKINDIRIKSLNKEENASVPILHRKVDKINDISAKNSYSSLNNKKVIFEDFRFVKKEKLQPIINNTVDIPFSQNTSEENFEELISSNRRNFLKIMVASSGVLLAGSFLSKINKIKNISLVNQSGATNAGSFPVPMMSEASEIDYNIDNNHQNFFDNFRLIKNKKEYILYNKQGDNILTIDRDT